jgi:hypothetical protein
VKENHINDDSGAENVELQDIIEDLPSEDDQEPSVESEAKSKTSKTTQPKVVAPAKKAPEKVVEAPANYDDADYESDKLFAYDSNEQDDEDESVDDSNVSGSMLGKRRR